MKVRIETSGGPVSVKAIEVATKDGKVDDKELRKILEEYDFIDQDWVDHVLPGLENARFVKTVPIYETRSRNRFLYPAETMKQFAEKTVGKPSYLGHEDVFDRMRGTGYRQPVARHIAGKETEVMIRIDGKEKTAKAAQFLVFISGTEIARNHFINLKEGLAGAMSIDADLKGQYVDPDDHSAGFNTAEVLDVQSIDFVNNGTEGVLGAGVTALVREQFKDDDARTGQGKQGDDPMADNPITLSSLEATADGREVKRQVEQAAQVPLNAQIKTLESEKAAGESKIKTLESEKSDLEKQSKELDAKNKELFEKNASLNRRIGVATVEAYRASVADGRRADITKLAKEKNVQPDYTILDMTVENLKESKTDAFLANDDDESFSKSKEAFKKSFDKQFETLGKMAERFGGVAVGTQEGTRTTRSGDGGYEGAMSSIFTDEALGKKAE